MLIPPPLSLYVHLPWCERKCPYCDFNSYRSEDAPPYAAYASRLLEDLEQDLPWSGGREFGSIFFGGGTPSLFPAAEIARILAGIRDRHPLAGEVEITLEANPGSAEAAKFRDFRAAGVNRLSIGVQSFHDASLRALGRVHDVAQARSAVAAARDAGFTELNLDLMHGLPGQSEAMALADLEQALGLGVPHVSWYQLTLEPNTVFYTQPPRLPPEPVLNGIQDRGLALLEARGYRRYEVSAFSLPGHECRHNLNYWRFGDYLGIGAGAHGKHTLAAENRILRSRKTRAPRDYLGAPVGQLATVEEVGVQERALEFLMNALRLRDGIAAGEFERCTGLALDHIAAPLAGLRREGLLRPDPGWLATTDRGFRFLDTVLGRFA